MSKLTAAFGYVVPVMTVNNPLLRSPLGSTLHWRIVDAKRGLLEEGHVPLAELARRAPWDYGER